MALKYKQYTYNGTWSPSTPPSTKASIKQIGIQGIPGTKVRFNGGNTDNTYVQLGYTGTYELDLLGTEGTINSIDFTYTDKGIWDQYGANKTLILDILYEENKEG